MPRRCVVNDCRVAKKEGVSHYRFPQNSIFREAWVKCVQCAKVDFARA